MATLTKESLIMIGFAEVGAWVPSEDTIVFELGGERATVSDVLVDIRNALYAFVWGEAVQYIGKTTQSVRKRFAGYRNPGQGQPTNLRCNARIKEVLAGGGEIDVLVFTPIPDLRYGDYDINLAAGLEDSLIKAFIRRGTAATEDSRSPMKQSARRPRRNWTAHRPKRSG